MITTVWYYLCSNSFIDYYYQYYCSLLQKAVAMDKETVCGSNMVLLVNLYSISGGASHV